MLRTALYVVIVVVMSQAGVAQCMVQQAVPLSDRNASYNIDVKLDTDSKTITGSQSLVWVNPSNDTIYDLRFYMYTNAFKNTESTFLKGASNLFGRDYSDRPAEAWGSIEVSKIIDQAGDDLISGVKYIQPDDGNPEDETVLFVSLNRPVLPQDTLKLEMDFVTKLPELLVRIGYSRDDFYHVTHWFPQIGVYEQDSSSWSWNCHQFHRGTEFFSDFGNYNVSIELPDHLMVEASGCRTEDVPTEQGRRKVTYAVEDVIDFAWVAYPHFKRFVDSWNGIEIRLLTATEHDNLAPRFIEAVKASLAYLEEHVGPYPYPSIAMMDPPIHALSSGFMEYPTYITLGSFRYFPKSVRTIESLVMHEFSHQYFMGMLASNEKEEAWLDEGFVTYFEDRTMEATYGGEGGSMISIFGMEINSSDFTRSEYIDLPDPSVGPVARPGWEITEGYKELVYSKTATVLKTLEGMVSRPIMDKIIRVYFEKWKFKHPKGQDFIAVVKQVLQEEGMPNVIGDIDHFFDQLIYGVAVCDYAVTSIENLRPHTKVGLFGRGEASQYLNLPESGLKGRVELRRLGGVVLPVEVVTTMLDGTKEIFIWSGEEALMVKEFEKEVVSCEIDPHQKLMIDIDRLNNSYTTQPDPWPVRKVGVKAIFWIQNLLQSFSFLV